MTSFNCSRRELVLFYIDNEKNISNLSIFLRENYHISEDNIGFIINDIQKKLLPQFNVRWAQASRKKDQFLRRNSDWLDKEYSVSLPVPMTQDESSPCTPSTSSDKRGRPCVPYEDSSESTKRRKNTTLLKEYGFQQIYETYLQGLRSMGELTEANVVELIRTVGTEKKKTIFEMISSDTGPKLLSDQEALSVFIDLDLTKAQYMYLRNLLNERRCFLLPSYTKIWDAKQHCYPPISSIEITNTYAKIIYFQDLLDHTAARILLIDFVYTNELKNLILYSKWGCDGSSGQSEYKQKLPGESELISDANLFIASFVPIRLIDESTGRIVWQNPAPSSVRFCRPILIEFSKETPEKTRTVVENIQNQINNLRPSLINKNGERVHVKHELFLTMIDGKVSQVLTDTPSSSTCTICGATPRLMNDLERVTVRPVNENNFQYGLSTLHAWIRCMEMILHISYNLSFERWSATSEENKRSKQEKKNTVQRRFREELGLIIDKPRQISGNSNDGNTARRFFRNANCSSEITGVDGTLIRRLYIILQALSSGIIIDAQKFGEYALETARIYVSKYNWYYMPSSVHKILIHGENIIKYFAVTPIGQLSEDAQESRNKDYRKFRLHHSRKCSRAATNEDVFHTLLYTSDPYITSIRKPYVKNFMELDEEALQLLKVNQLVSDPEV